MPTLLALHGGPGLDHSLLKPEFSAFSDIAQVVYLDHRGNGRSDRDVSERWNFDQWADDIRAFCDALEIEHPIVFGESFGGMVAMAYAIRHPDHPARLILASTAAKIRPERAFAMFERLGGKDARDTAQRFFDNPAPDMLQEFSRKCIPLYNRRHQSGDRIARAVANVDLLSYFFRGESRTFDFLPMLGRIRCPTLIIAGEMDPILPLADAEDLAAAIPSSLVRLERFPNAGHGVQRDDPERFTQVVRDFITA